MFPSFYDSKEKSMIPYGQERSGIESPILDIDILQEEQVAPMNFFILYRSSCDLITPEHFTKHVGKKKRRHAKDFSPISMMLSILSKINLTNGFACC